MRHAFRSLAKSPGFTAVALITLALGIGANTTAYSVLNALMLHEPPYPDPAAIVRVYRTSPRTQTGAVSAPNFYDYQAQNTVFAHMAATQFSNFNLGEPGQPADRLRAMNVTPDFFAVLGTAPALGRTFRLEEDRPGNNAVLVLSHHTWVQRFGGDASIVGRTVRVDGEPVTIIGVMPASFHDVMIWGDVGAWRPMAFSDALRAQRGNSSFGVIARLKRGVSLDNAQTAMSALVGRLALAYPDTNRNQDVRLVRLDRTIQDATGRRITWLVVGLASFVLLIACANLANLQFARYAARGREHAIRAALGASRAQLVRLVLGESVLLSIVGGTIGLVLALWSNEFVGRAFTFGDNSPLDVALDQRVLAFTFLVSVATGVGFGLLPAWLASRANVGDALKQGSRGSTASRSQHRVRHALIVGEIALALVLLAGAGFFLRGLQRFTQRDPGWRAENLLTADISLSGRNYATEAARDAFHRRWRERVAALPGVERVAIANGMPTWGYSTGVPFVVEGQAPSEAGRGPHARINAVTPGYFDTLGIRLLQGRDFTAADTGEQPRMVIINESMARQLWPGENPIGKRIGDALPFMDNPREVIGVVNDVSPISHFGEFESKFQFYRPLAQWNVRHATIALRTRIAPEVLAAELRRTVTELDSDQALFRISTVSQDARRGLRSIDAAGTTMLGFALLGLLLAAVGIYGVIANSVVQRTNEIGIRMALGAQVRDILALVLGGGLRLTVIGTALGLAGAYGVARLVGAIHAEFSVADPLLVGAVTLCLVLVALFACWLPARRAAKVDPIIALRAE